MSAQGIGTNGIIDFDEHDVIDYEHVAWAYSLWELQGYEPGFADYE